MWIEGVYTKTHIKIYTSGCTWVESVCTKTHTRTHIRMHMCVECVQGQILRVNLKSVYTKTQCQFPPETDRLGERERESKRERERDRNCARVWTSVKRHTD